MDFSPQEQVIQKDASSHITKTRPNWSEAQTAARSGSAAFPSAVTQPMWPGTAAHAQPPILADRSGRVINAFSSRITLLPMDLHALIYGEDSPPVLSAPMKGKLSVMHLLHLLIYRSI